MTWEALCGCFLGGFTGAALWHWLVAIWRRGRWVITTRSLVVRHPQVAKVTSGVSNAFAGVGDGDIELRPSPRIKVKKPSRRERVLRALGGYESP